MNIKIINKSINSHISLINNYVQYNNLLIEKCVNEIIECFNKGNKILIFGNGGSASDSQHLAAEFVNKFKLFRKGLPAISLTSDTSVITSIANDFGYQYIFSKQIEAIGKEGDIAIGISTSGKSVNVINGINYAKGYGLKTITFTGKKSLNIPKKYIDLSFKVPSLNTPRIQEIHLFLFHLICELVEDQLFNPNSK